MYIIDNTKLIVKDTASFPSILFVVQAGQINTL